MPRSITNLLLLGLVLAQALSGLAGWLLPDGWALPFYDLHRAGGVALLLVLFWKQGIARASLRWRLRRRPWDRSVLLGGLAALALLGALGFGLAWTLNLVSFESLWGYSPLNLHVFLGLALLALLTPHVAVRWERRPPLRVLASRRSALRLAGLAVGALVGWRLLETTASALAAPGARRPSGSKHAGSFSGNAYPVTMWLFDPIPSIEVDAWRLEVVGRVEAPGALTLAELRALPQREAQAVLDCTSGWWSEQVWRGVAVLDVLAARGLKADARQVAVVSVTGHRQSFPLTDLRDALLATHVGGEVLSAGHGYPLRLVAPGRRGFQWVKWIGRLEVT